MSRVRHVVLYRLAAPDPEQQHRDFMGIKERMESAEHLAIPGIIELRVERDLGFVDGHWDVGLISDFESNESLEAYQADPRHTTRSSWASTVVTERASFDYRLDH